MKLIYTGLYIVSLVILLVSLTGGGVSRSLFESLSEKTIEKTGFQKSYVQSVDNKIDDLIYKSKQIELQIEKIKKFFSSDKIDESRYSREESKMLENAVYTPLVNMFILVYRIFFGVISLMVLCFAVIFHLIYRSLDLRRRVVRLEEALNTGKFV
ncbi:MAG: hypothetical protein JSS91_06800 [Bacteroidetes bacterium]|nr:hypothetical protein [Bacteroidota bacterium]